MTSTIQTTGVLKHVYNFLAAWVFTAAPGLSLLVASRGYSLVAVCGLLIAVTSLVVEHGL